MKTQDTAAALERLRAAGVAGQPVFCVQNGVANERMALRRFPNVHGVTVMMPASFTDAGRGRGLLDAAARHLRHRALPGRAATRPTGRWRRRSRRPASPPSSTDEVMASKYGKLLLNLGNIVEAALGPDVRTGGASTRCCAPRARRSLAAAGIAWRDVGAADPRREALMRQAEVAGARRSGGSTTQSLARGTGSIETDWLNGEIVLLGRLHGVPTPANGYFLGLGARLAREGRGPGDGRRRRGRGGAGRPRGGGADDATRSGPEFWRRFPLEELNRAEWEALCDGCAKCCLIKLEDEDTGAVAYTSVACRLLDLGTCRCGNYPLRRQLVRGCVVLDRDNLESVLPWMPRTCAYRLVHEGRDLEPWHPLISGDPESVHRAGVSLRGRMVPEFEVAEEDWEDFVIEEDV